MTYTYCKKEECSACKAGGPDAIDLEEYTEKNQDVYFCKDCYDAILSYK